MKLFSRIFGLLATKRGRVGAAGLAGILMLPAVALAEGMPQLDFNTPLTISQVVWGAIIFIVLYVLLSNKGLPLVASVLDERAAHIGRDLEGARSAKTAADSGIAEAQEAIARARADAQSAINAALDEAKQRAAAQSEALNTRLEARLQEAEAQIGQARAAAMSALREVATNATISVVTRLTGAAPEPARLDSAVTAALNARGVASGVG